MNILIKAIAVIIVIVFIVIGCGYAGNWDYEQAQLEAANHEAHKYETVGE